MFRSGSLPRRSVLALFLVVALLVAAAVVVYAATSGAEQAGASAAQPAAASALRSSLQVTSTTTPTPVAGLQLTLTTIVTQTSVVALTPAELDQIVQQAVTAANAQSSLLRVNPLGRPANTAMQIAIVDRVGRQLRFYGMPDAWVGSINIAIGKARTAAYFSSDQNALTSRSVGALSQPGGDLWQIGNSNVEGPVSLIEFPGGIPLYKGNFLVGAIGVSGDGVQQDEAVAVAGARGFEPPSAIRVDVVTNGAVPYTAPSSAATATPTPALGVTASPSATTAATATSAIGGTPTVMATGTSAATSTVMATGTAAGTPTAAATGTISGTPTVMTTGTPLASPTVTATGTVTTTGSTGAAPATVTVNTATAGQFGTILVDSNGMSLYFYARDSLNTSACTGSCATNWPPLYIAEGGTPMVGAGVTGILSVIERPDGTYQLAYNGKPLYLWVRDTKPGDVNGDGVGGVWTVAKP